MLRAYITCVGVRQEWWWGGDCGWAGCVGGRLSWHWQLPRSHWQVLHAPAIKGMRGVVPQGPGQWTVNVGCMGVRGVCVWVAWVTCGGVWGCLWALLLPFVLLSFLLEIAKAKAFAFHLISDTRLPHTQIFFALPPRWVGCLSALHLILISSNSKFVYFYSDGFLSLKGFTYWFICLFCNQNRKCQRYLLNLVNIVERP